MMARLGTARTNAKRAAFRMKPWPIENIGGGDVCRRSWPPQSATGGPRKNGVEAAESSTGDPDRAVSLYRQLLPQPVCRRIVQSQGGRKRDALAGAIACARDRTRRQQC